VPKRFESKSAELLIISTPTATVDVGGSPKALAAEDLTAMVVHFYPTSPRIGLAASDSVVEGTSRTRFFWQLPGEIPDNAPNIDADGEGGERLAGVGQFHEQFAR
jgi:hypothetical protein